MSEKAPQTPSKESTSTADLLSRVDDLAGDRFSVTSNDRLQLKAGTTATDAEGNVKKVGGRFESKHQLEDIAAFEDQIRLGMKAKELAPKLADIESALDYARDKVATMNETQPTKSTLKEVGVMRHALVSSSALSAPEVENMSDDDVKTLVEYMRATSSEPGTDLTTIPLSYNGEFDLDPNQFTIAPREEFSSPSDTATEDTPSVSTSGLTPARRAVIVNSDGAPAPEVAPRARAFRAGDVVNVLRTEGGIEADWKVIQLLDDGRYRVGKDLDNGSRMVKAVAAADLEAWNPTEAPRETRWGIIKYLSRFMSERFSKQERSRIRRKALGATAIAGLTLTALFSPTTSHDSVVDEVAESVQMTETSLDTPLVPVVEPLSAAAGTQEAAGHAAANTQELAGAPEIADWSLDAQEAAPSEGWSEQLQQMGVPSGEVPSLLNKLLASSDPGIKEWVYTMNNGDPGIAKPGAISPDVLQSIQKLRN